MTGISVFSQDQFSSTIWTIYTEVHIILREQNPSKTKRQSSYRSWKSKSIMGYHQLNPYSGYYRHQ